MSLLFTLNGLNADQKSTVNDGSKFGKEACARNGKVNHEALINELTPLDQKGKSFDGKNAKQNMKAQKFQQDASSELLKDPAILRYYDFKPDEKSIQHSDKIIDDYANGTIEQNESEGDWKTEKCLEQGVPYALEVAYSLNVQVKKTPEVKITYQACNGHERYIDWFLV